MQLWWKVFKLRGDMLFFVWFGFFLNQECALNSFREFICIFYLYIYDTYCRWICMYWHLWYVLIKKHCFNQNWLDVLWFQVLSYHLLISVVTSLRSDRYLPRLLRIEVSHRVTSGLTKQHWIWMNLGYALIKEVNYMHPGKLTCWPPKWRFGRWLSFFNWVMFRFHFSKV